MTKFIRNAVILAPALSILYVSLYYRAFFEDFGPLSNSILHIADYLAKAIDLFSNVFPMFTFFGWLFFVFVMSTIKPRQEEHAEQCKTKSGETRGASKESDKLARFVVPIGLILGTILFWLFVPFGDPAVGWLLLMVFAILFPFYLLYGKYPKADPRFGVALFILLVFVITAQIHGKVDANRVAKAAWTGNSYLVVILTSGYLYVDDKQLVLKNNDLALLQTADVKEPMPRLSQACWQLKIFCIGPDAKKRQNYQHNLH